MAEINDFESPADFELTHHVLPGEPGRDHIAEMAEAFIVEFRRMRWTDDAILAMFRNPFYAGPHYVYRERGQQYVINLIKRMQIR